MSITVTNNNKSFETSTLTSTSLFLNRHDFQNFIFQQVGSVLFTSVRRNWFDEFFDDL
eukprot:Awhi_evm1s11954